MGSLLILMHDFGGGGFKKFKAVIFDVSIFMNIRFIYYKNARVYFLCFICEFSLFFVVIR